jgi:hypothetical protein
LNWLWLDRIDSNQGIRLLSPRHHGFCPFSIFGKERERKQKNDKLSMALHGSFISCGIKIGMETK